MNAVIPLSATELVCLGDNELVNRLVTVAGMNNEYNCRDALDQLEAEVKRRLRERRHGAG